MSKTLITRIPTADVDGSQLMIYRGTEEVLLGEVVTVQISGQETFDAYVRDIVICSILDTPREYLDIFAFPNQRALRSFISLSEGISLPAETMVTFIVLADADAELPSLYKEPPEAEETGEVELPEPWEYSNGDDE